VKRALDAGVRRFLGLWSLGVIMVGAIPLLIQVPLAFSNVEFLVFPPPEYGLEQFRRVIANERWAGSAQVSFQVALTASLIATTVGSAAALGARGLPGRLRGALRFVVLTPLIVPGIVVAVAILNAYAGARLVGNWVALSVAHATLGLPLVYLLASSGLARLPPQYWEASASLGAGPLRTALQVILPIIAPSILAGGVLAFATSWDEVVIAIFVGGSRSMTLPRYMFGYLRTEITPQIAAVSIVLLVISVLLFLTVTVLRGRRA